MGGDEEERDEEEMRKREESEEVREMRGEGEGEGRGRGRGDKEEKGRRRRGEDGDPHSYTHTITRLSMRPPRCVQNNQSMHPLPNDYSEDTTQTKHRAGLPVMHNMWQVPRESGSPQKNSKTKNEVSKK